MSETLRHVVKEFKKLKTKPITRTWDKNDERASCEGKSIQYMQDNAVQPVLGKFLIRNAASPTFKSPKSMQGKKGYC